MTSAEAVMLQEYDPLRDKTYRRAALGPDVVAFLAWLELGGASPITVENYERALAVVCRMYPQTEVRDLTDLQLGQVFRRFPVKSRRVRVAPYRSFFKWARQTRRISENPMELIPTFKRQPQKQFDLFSEAEIDVLYALPIIDAAPMALLFEAGLRRREACEMTDRRWNPDWVQVIGGKGGKDRRIPTSERLASMLAEWEIVEGINPDDSADSGVITKLAPRSANYRGRDTGGNAPMSDQPIGLKYKLAARVIFTTFTGDRFPGRVVDASRDHVTVVLYGGPNRGRTFRVGGDDIARCIARDTRRRR